MTDAFCQTPFVSCLQHVDGGTQTLRVTRGVTKVVRFVKMRAVFTETVIVSRLRSWVGVATPLLTLLPGVYGGGVGFSALK